MRAKGISVRVTVGFLALFVVLVAAFLANVHAASRLSELSANVTRSREIVREIELTRTTLRDLESARRGYVITREDQFLELFLAMTKENVARLDRLRDVTADDPAQRRRVDGIAQLVAQQLAIVTDTIGNASDRTRTPDEIRSAAHEGDVVTNQILGLVAELQDAETTRLRDREAEANARTVKVIRGFGVIALIALLLLGAAYYIVDHDAAVHAALLEELRMHEGQLAARSPDIDEPRGLPAHGTGEHAPST